MHVIQLLAAALIGVTVYDWIAITGTTARYTRFEYQYWPFTRARKISIGILIAGVFASLLLTDEPQEDQEFWKIIPVSVAFCLHGLVAIVDVSRQRSAYVPPEPSGRYGD